MAAGNLKQSDAKGNIVFRANGVIHEFVPESERSREHLKWKTLPFPVQLEFLEFEKLTDDTSKLTMHIVYKSVELVIRY